MILKDTNVVFGFPVLGLALCMALGIKALERIIASWISSDGVDGAFV